MVPIRTRSQDWLGLLYAFAACGVTDMAVEFEDVVERFGLPMPAEGWQILVEVSLMLGWLGAVRNWHLAPFHRRQAEALAHDGENAQDLHAKRDVAGRQRRVLRRSHKGRQVVL